MLYIVEMFSDMVGDIIAAIPSVLAAIIVILIGYAIGIVVGNAVNKLVEKLGIERNFDKTSTGQAFKNAGLDLSNFIGGVTKAFITILAIILAIQILNVGGTIGTYLTTIADYLPRLLGGILLIVFGTVLVDFLSSFIGRMIKPMFPEAKVEIADMLKNLLMIGLVAFVLALALDLMLLSGDLIYPLIIGFVIIGAGISLTDGLIKSINDDHVEFKGVAGYAKFVLYSIFLIIGAGAIFATFPGVTTIIANVSWAFAIALAIMLIPIAYAMAKKMSKET
jgi:MFS family permease